MTDLRPSSHGPYNPYPADGPNPLDQPVAQPPVDAPSGPGAPGGSGAAGPSTPAAPQPPVAPVDAPVPTTPTPPAAEYIEIDGERVPLTDVRTIREFYRWAMANPTLANDLIDLSAGRARLTRENQPNPSAPAPPASGSPAARPPANQPAAAPADPDDPVYQELAQLRTTVAATQEDLARIRAASVSQMAGDAKSRLMNNRGLSQAEADEVLKFAAANDLVGLRAKAHGYQNLNVAMDEGLEWAFRVRFPERASAPTRQSNHRMIGGPAPSAAGRPTQVNGNGNGAPGTGPNGQPLDRRQADQAMRAEVAAAMGFDPNSL